MTQKQSPPPQPVADPPLDPLARRAMRILISKLIDHYRADQAKEASDERGDR